MPDGTGRRGIVDEFEQASVAGEGEGPPSINSKVQQGSVFVIFGRLADVVISKIKTFPLLEGCVSRCV